MFVLTRAKHHEHIPSLTLKEKELERLKRERELKESGLTGEITPRNFQSLFLVTGNLRCYFEDACFSSCDVD